MILSVIMVASALKPIPGQMSVAVVTVKHGRTLPNTKNTPLTPVKPRPVFFLPRCQPQEHSFLERKLTKRSRVTQNQPE